MQRAKTFLAFIGALTLLLLGVVAVRSCDDDADPSARIGPGPLPATSTTATSGSPTLDKITLRKRLVVSMPRDNPGLSSREGAGSELAGFDVEITKIVAAGLGLSEDAVSFKPLPANTIDDALASGDVDLAFGALVIGKAAVELAGPYLATSVDVLVPAASATTDLAAVAAVCAVAGTGDADRLRARAPAAKITEAVNLGQCLSRLRAGQVEAIVADDGLLRGLASTEPGRYRLLAARLAEQSYGIGLPASDAVFRAKINEVLAEAARNGRWQAAYATTLGRSGVPAEPPPISR